MAIAVKKTETVITGVTLTLSAEEAEALAVVLHHVGGMTGGPRRHVRALAGALRHAGIERPGWGAGAVGSVTLPGGERSSWEDPFRSDPLAEVLRRAGR
ncbi:hypothetical protein ACWDRR_00735 [Kitasatospora sp. NPDC003701]